MSIPSERMFESTFEVLAWARKEALTRDDCTGRDAEAVGAATEFVKWLLRVSDDSDEKWQT